MRRMAKQKEEEENNHRNNHKKRMIELIGSVVFLFARKIERFPSCRIIVVVCDSKLLFFQSKRFFVFCKILAEILKNHLV